jgi:hypothetical protein
VLQQCSVTALRQIHLLLDSTSHLKVDIGIPSHFRQELPFDANRLDLVQPTCLFQFIDAVIDTELRRRQILDLLSIVCSCHSNSLLMGFAVLLDSAAYAKANQYAR